MKRRNFLKGALALVALPATILSLPKKKPTRKLKTVWKFESDQDLKAAYNILDENGGWKRGELNVIIAAGRNTGKSNLTQEYMEYLIRSRTMEI